MSLGEKLHKHKMFAKYFVRLCCRCIIFLIVLALYIFRRELVESFIDFSLFGKFSLVHVLWIILMGGMLLHLLPKTHITMSGRKSRPDTYVEPPNSYERLELLEYVQLMNRKAWIVMLVWLSFNAIFAALYLTHVIGRAELLMLTFFYFTSDLICMLVFCPFQTFIMGNRCCVNCRIFDWGHFMMYTPMMFIPSFFSWSLFFTSCVVLIRWELAYAKHPERFWRGSNATIRCENCQDKMCQIKKPLNKALGGKQAESPL